MLRFLGKIKPKWFVIFSLLLSLIFLVPGTNAVFNDQENGNVRIVVDMPEDTTEPEIQLDQFPEAQEEIIVQVQETLSDVVSTSEAQVANELINELPVQNEAVQLETSSIAAEETQIAATEEVESNEASAQENSVLPEISQAQDETSAAAVP